MLERNGNAMTESNNDALYEVPPVQRTVDPAYSE